MPGEFLLLHSFIKNNFSEIFIHFFIRISDFFLCILPERFSNAAGSLSSISYHTCIYALYGAGQRRLHERRFEEKQEYNFHRVQPGLQSLPERSEDDYRKHKAI